MSDLAEYATFVIYDLRGRVLGARRALSEGGAIRSYIDTLILASFAPAPKWLRLPESAYAEASYTAKIQL